MDWAFPSRILAELDCLHLPVGVEEEHRPGPLGADHRDSSSVARLDNRHSAAVASVGIDRSWKSVDKDRVVAVAAAVAVAVEEGIAGSADD